MNLFYAQLIGAAAMLVIVLSVQFKKKKNVMIVQAIANTLYFVEYAVLEAYSAASLNLITIVRIFLFYRYDKKEKNVPWFLCFVFVIIIIGVGIYNYNGLLDVIPISITIAYTIGATYKNPNVFKKVFLICSFFWFIYNFSVSAYVVAFGNICEIVSTMFALKRYKKKK